MKFLPQFSSLHTYGRTPLWRFWCSWKKQEELSSWNNVTYIWEWLFTNKFLRSLNDFPQFGSMHLNLLSSDRDFVNSFKCKLMLLCSIKNVWVLGRLVVGHFSSSPQIARKSHFAWVSSWAVLAASLNEKKYIEISQSDQRSLAKCNLYSPLHYWTVGHTLDLYKRMAVYRNGWNCVPLDLKPNINWMPLRRIWFVWARSPSVFVRLETIYRNLNIICVLVHGKSLLMSSASTFSSHERKTPIRKIWNCSKANCKHFKHYLEIWSKPILVSSGKIFTNEFSRRPKFFVDKCRTEHHFLDLFLLFFFFFKQIYKLW